MLPIDRLTKAEAEGIRFVLFDIDDTITKNGKLLYESYEALWKLRAAGITAIPVTGRPAGWCDLIARQWPVAAVVGENGAFAFYMDDDRLMRLYHVNAPHPEAVRKKLKRLGEKVLRHFPELRCAKDQAYRMFDIALDFAEEEPRLSLDYADAVKRFCVSLGAEAKVSSIHVNAWFGLYDKVSMSEQFLSTVFGWSCADVNSVLYFGDSPNDEPMFSRFPLSCGVANVMDYAALMTSMPRYVTSNAFGAGFAEGIARLLSARHGV